MIQVEMRTGDHHCDRCGAHLTAAAAADERKYSAFLQKHGQCTSPAIPEAQVHAGHQS